MLARAQAAGDLPAAEATFGDALARYDALGNTPLAAEARASLAALALARGDLNSALAQVEVLLSVLAGYAYAGLDEPFDIYLTCYRTPQAAGDPRATMVRTSAVRLLDEYAGRIDHALRRSFLERVPVHRMLQESAR